MSDDFMLPRPPLVTAAKALDAARHYKALAKHMADLGHRAEAGRLERDSQRWLTYSIALAQTPPAAEGTS